MTLRLLNNPGKTNGVKLRPFMTLDVTFFFLQVPVHDVDAAGPRTTIGGENILANSMDTRAQPTKLESCFYCVTSDKLVNLSVLQLSYISNNDCHNKNLPQEFM